MGKLSVKDSMKIGVISRKEISKFIFLMAFSLLIYADYISATSLTNAYIGRVFQGVMLLLLLKILLTKYTKKEIVILAVAMVLAIISYVKTDSYFVAMLIMLLMASKDMELRLLMKIYFTIVSGITLLVAILALLGISGDVFLQQDFRGNGLEIRYCFGYTHPNTFHIVVIQIFLSFIWIYWDKMKWYYFILIFVINTFVYHYTDSRTNLVLGSAMVMAYILLKAIPKLRKWIGIYIGGFVTLVFCFVLSILTYIYGVNCPILDKLNKLWTGRIIWAYLENQHCVITPFSYLNCSANCDMGFVKMTYNYGWVIMLLVILLFLGILWKITEKKDYVMLISVVICLVFYLGENFSSGEYITRNLIFVYMLGWNTNILKISKG